MPRFLTPKALKRLKKKLQYLKEVKRKEIAEKIKRAAEFGDTSDSAAYSVAKEEQAFLEGEILELENLIKNAKIVKPGAKKGKVAIGSKILVKNEEGKKEFELVPSIEAEPSKGKISASSPLGEALLGKKKGEKVEIKTPKGKVEYKILKVE